MDVTAWPLSSRMKLPDHCFGNRQLLSVFVSNGGVGTMKWGISSIALPDPVCIWRASFKSQPTTNGYGYMRIGLRSAVPTSEAEMNAADEIFPAYGTPHAGPNIINVNGQTYQFWTLETRKGMVTGAKYLVVENKCNAATMRVQCSLLISSLPTKIPGWPGAWPA